MVDFDRVYQELIGPSIEAAQMEPLPARRGDDRGIIHKPVFERLILRDCAVADFTTAAGGPPDDVPPCGPRSPHVSRRPARRTRTARCSTSWRAFPTSSA